MKKIVCVLFSLLLLVGLLVGCTDITPQATNEGQNNSTQSSTESTDQSSVTVSDQSDAEPIKIGVWEPLTGQFASGGEQHLEGFELANKLRPTVLGRPVQLVIADNKSDKVEAANSMSRLVEKEKVDFILGPWGSSLALAGVDISESAGIPTITGAASLLITDGRYWVIRTTYADPIAGVIAAIFAETELNAKTAVILTDIAGDYSVSLTKFFTDSFTEKTGNQDAIIANVNYSSGDQDFSALLNIVKEKNPDVLFMPGYYQDVALLMIQMKEMGIDIPVLVGDGAVVPELISIGGKAVEGLYVNAHFSPDQAADNPLAAKFVDEFKQMYNKMPSSDNAVSFVDYNLMLDAIETAKDPTDKKAVMEFLRNLNKYPTVTGNITMDPQKGTPYKSAPILTIKDGEFKYVTTVEP